MTEHNKRKVSIQVSNNSVGGVCNFLGSVLTQQRFEMVDQHYSWITAQSFIRQAKESTPFLLHEGGPTPKERAHLGLASSFYMFVSSPP